MNLLITGGRDYDDAELVGRVLDRLQPKCIIHGGAKGADSLGGSWARKNGVPEIVVAAQWDTYGKAAGGLRNAWMLEFTRVEEVVAFDGGAGTQSMVDLAKGKGLKIYDIRGHRQ